MLGDPVFLEIALENEGFSTPRANVLLHLDVHQNMGQNVLFAIKYFVAGVIGALELVACLFVLGVDNDPVPFQSVHW